MLVRKPIPTVAWFLSGGTAIALVVLAVPTLVSHGQSRFFTEGDAYLYRATARDLFGHGRAFAAVNRLSEVPYRYGRMGLPFLAWLLVLGRPGLVAWPLIGIHLAAIAAIPGLAAVLLDDYGAPPIGGAVVLLVPGLLVVYDKVFADPLLIALILLAFHLDHRGRPKSALGALAFAILVKEVGALALIPWLWRALRDRDRRRVLGLAATIAPYAAWCVWLRVRVGEFPFLAHTSSRTGALGLPGVGIRDALVTKTPDYRIVIPVVLVTIAIGLVAAWRARRFPVAGAAAAYAVLTMSLGPVALTFEGETLRVLALPQTFALLCVVLAMAGPRDAVPNDALSGSNGDL